MEMKQEEKNLLLKDLCARLPYGVKVNVAPVPHKDYKHIFFNAKIVCVDVNYIGVLSDNGFLLQQDVTEIKPYLRPMSSMTEEQIEEYKTISIWGEVRKSKVGRTSIAPTVEGYDWLNKNHFDYR